MIQGISGNSYESVNLNTPSAGKNEINPAEVKSLKRAGAVECSTCSGRKYQDGSSEMVSFKAPSHISPGTSGAAVMSHEQEHVSNAYAKAARKNGQVIKASISLRTATCPECGRSYVSGGTTTTMIRYQKESPYSMNAKSSDYGVLAGNNLDLKL